MFLSSISYLPSLFISTPTICSFALPSSILYYHSLGLFINQLCYYTHIRNTRTSVIRDYPKLSAFLAMEIPWSRKCPEEKLESFQSTKNGERAVPNLLQKPDNSKPAGSVLADDGIPLTYTNRFSFTQEDETLFTCTGQGSSLREPEPDLHRQHPTDGFQGPSSAAQALVPSSTADNKRESTTTTHRAKTGQSLEGLPKSTSTRTFEAGDIEPTEALPPIAGLSPLSLSQGPSLDDPRPDLQIQPLFYVCQDPGSRAEEPRPSSAGDAGGRRPMLGNRVKTTNGLSRLPQSNFDLAQVPTGGSSQETVAGSTPVAASEPKPESCRSPQQAASERESARAATQPPKEADSPNPPATPEEIADIRLFDRCKQFVRRLPSILVHSSRENMASELCAATKRDVTQQAKRKARKTTSSPNGGTKGLDVVVKGPNMPDSATLEPDIVGKPSNPSAPADTVNGNHLPQNAAEVQPPAAHEGKRVRWSTEHNDGDHDGKPRRKGCQHSLRFCIKCVFGLASLRRRKNSNSESSNGVDSDASVRPSSKMQEDSAQSLPGYSAAEKREPRLQKWKRKWKEFHRRERDGWDAGVRDGEARPERGGSEIWSRRIGTIELRGRRRLRKRNRQQDNEANTSTVNARGPISPPASGQPSTETAMC
jgi:hypothetical protein